MAAAAILYLGIQSVFTKHHTLPEIKVSASASVYRGFFMNIINPFVMLLWVEGLFLTANPAWLVAPKVADQASKSYVEFTLLYTDRNSGHILSLYSLQ